MSKQLTAYDQPLELADVPKRGQEILEHLRGHAGTITTEAEEPVLHNPKDEDGNPRMGILGKPLMVPMREVDEDGKPGAIITKTVKTEKLTPNRRRMIGIDSQFFYRFGALVATADDEDLERLRGIIGRQRFDIGPALAAYEAKEFAFDTSVRPATWEDCERLRSVTMVSLRAYKGDTKAEALITKMLELFLLKFGKRSDITPALVRELAAAIIKDFPSLTLAQVKMVLNLAGGQSAVTDRTFNVDYSSLYAMFSEMFNDRSEWSANKIYNEHLAAKSDPFERSARPNVRMESDTFINTKDAAELMANHIKNQDDLQRRREAGE